MTEAADELRRILARNPGIRIDDVGATAIMSVVSRRVGYDVTAAHSATEDEMQASEAEIQQAIIEALLLDGWQVWRINSGAARFDDDGEDRYVEFCRWGARGYEFSAAGNPDVIAIRGGLALLVETKTKDGKLRESQVRCFEAAEQCNNTYVVARGVEDVAPWLTRVEVDDE